MISFFHKLRKQLAYDHQFLKYSRYAIGEIFLVVIGILIALEVNNWNESRKEDTLETLYLQRLTDDLQRDIVFFRDKISNYESYISSHKAYIERCYHRQENYEEFVALVDHINLDAENFTSQNATYTELTNSGHLNIFDNIQLKEKIVSHYRDYDQIAKHIQEFNEYTGKFLSRIPIGLGTFYTPVKPPLSERVKKSRWEWVNQPDSEQFLFVLDLATLYASKFSVFLNYYQSLVAKSESLKNAIREELDTGE